MQIDGNRYGDFPIWKERELIDKIDNEGALSV